MDIETTLKQLADKAGTSVDDVAAKLAEKAGIAATDVNGLLSALSERAKGGAGDAQALFDDVAAKAGIEADRVKALFLALRADVKEKGLPGFLDEARARFDKDGDGNVLDDLGDMVRGLFGRKD